MQLHIELEVYNDIAHIGMFMQIYSSEVKPSNLLATTLQAIVLSSYNVKIVIVYNGDMV